MLWHCRQNWGRIWPPCKRVRNNLRFGAMENIELRSKTDLNISKWDESMKIILDLEEYLTKKEGVLLASIRTRTEKCVLLQADCISLTTIHSNLNFHSFAVLNLTCPETSSQSTVAWSPMSSPEISSEISMVYFMELRLERWPWRHVFQGTDSCHLWEEKSFFPPLSVPVRRLKSGDLWWQHHFILY